MPNSTSCAVSGVAVGPRQPLAQMEHVAQAVVGDLPALGERRHDRALGPRLDEPVEQLHAELDVRPRDRGARVGVVRAGSSSPTRSVAVARRRTAPAAPEVERALVRLVRLREPQRHVQRERELEQHERDLASLAAPLEDRQQLAVVPDRLVEGVLLTRAVAGASSGTRPPCPRRRRRASGARAGRRPRPRGRRSAPRAIRPPRGAGGSRSSATSVRYAASWISACLKRYSGSGHRRPSRTRSRRMQRRERLPHDASSAPHRPPRAAAARTAARAPTRP